MRFALARVNSRRGIFDIYFGNEQNCLGKEQDSKNYNRANKFVKTALVEKYKLLNISLNKNT